MAAAPVPVPVELAPHNNGVLQHHPSGTPLSLHQRLWCLVRPQRLVLQGRRLHCAVWARARALWAVLRVSVRPERYRSNPSSIAACGLAGWPSMRDTVPHSIWCGVRRYTPRRTNPSLTLLRRRRRRGMADTDPWELRCIARMGRHTCTCVALCSDGRARFALHLKAVRRAEGG